MLNRKPLWMLALLILPILMTACGNNHADQRISHAEGYLENLAVGNVNAAQEHVCERRQAEIDRIVQSTTSFNGQRGTFAIDNINCQASDHFVECKYTLSAEIFELVENDDGKTEQVLLADDSQTITEIYAFEDERVCGVVETTVEDERVEMPSTTKDDRSVSDNASSETASLE